MKLPFTVTPGAIVSTALAATCTSSRRTMVQSFHVSVPMTVPPWMYRVLFVQPVVATGRRH